VSISLMDCLKLFDFLLFLFFMLLAVFIIQRQVRDQVKG
jgi:hypothetical protein